RRRHTRFDCDWSSDVCSSDLDTADEDRIRMQLLSALGWSLMYGEGRAREARPILETTLELADRLDDKDFRLRALWGLCIDQFNRSEEHTSELQSQSNLVCRLL